MTLWQCTRAVLQNILMLAIMSLTAQYGCQGSARALTIQHCPQMAKRGNRLQWPLQWSQFSTCWNLKTKTSNICFLGRVHRKRGSSPTRIKKIKDSHTLSNLQRWDLFRLKQRALTFLKMLKSENDQILVLQSLWKLPRICLLFLDWPNLLSLVLFLNSL